MLVNKYIIFFGQNFEFTTIVLLPRASHPDTQMTEVISLRSNRAKDCPGKSNSFPQKFAKILTFTGVIYDFIQSISEYADAIWWVLTWFGDESTILCQTEVNSLWSWPHFRWGKTFTAVIYDFILSVWCNLMTFYLIWRWFNHHLQTEVNSLRSWSKFRWGKTLPGPGKSNSFPQKFAKILTFHSGLRIGIKRTTNSELLNIVKILSGSIFPCQLYLKHIKWQRY